jgi:hypothetical protein
MKLHMSGQAANDFGKAPSGIRPALRDNPHLPSVFSIHGFAVDGQSFSRRSIQQLIMLISKPPSWNHIENSQLMDPPFGGKIRHLPQRTIHRRLFGGIRG